MAKKRMFRLDVIETDEFMDMPLTTQALYFHLNLRADDDGFIGNPNQICRMIGASKDDLNVLIAKMFVLTFGDGVIVIKHWRLHNTLSKDRYNETRYIEDKQLLRLNDDNSYTFEGGDIIDDTKKIAASTRQVTSRRTEDAHETHTDKYSIDKISEDKVSGDKVSIIPASDEPKHQPKHKYGEYNHVMLTDKEYEKLCTDFGEDRTKDAITYLDEYIEMKGYKAKNHNLCIRKWVFDALDRKKRETKPTDDRYRGIDKWLKQSLDS